MIISASRRTDIPAFYAPWFFNRLREGYLMVPNPFNPKAVSRISLDPAVVDCIVFWTKNPAPMLPRLRELERYKYYFQFTLNPYGADVENRLPDLSRRIETFKRLSDAIGRDRVIWRYDPILTNGKYDVGFHCEAFARIARALRDHTAKCMLGFIDHYRHIRGALGELGVGPLRRDEIEVMAQSFVRTLEPYSVALETCTVKVDLRHLGIPSGMCIDRGLVERIAGYPIAAKKDKNQRQVCNCIESIDVGTYETCLNGCAYCYAIKGNYNTAEYNRRRHDPDSPLMMAAGWGRRDQGARNEEPAVRTAAAVLARRNLFRFVSFRYFAPKQFVGAVQDFIAVDCLGFAVGLNQIAAASPSFDRVIALLRFADHRVSVHQVPENVPQYIGVACERHLLSAQVFEIDVVEVFSCPSHNRSVLSFGKDTRSE